MKNPRTEGRGSFETLNTFGLEPVVHAGAHDIGVEVHIGCETGARHVAALLAEIDVEIFDLCGPRTGDRGFQPAAECPPGFCFGQTSEARLRRFDIADGETAGQVRHEAIKRITDASADGAEPVVARFAYGARADSRRRAALDVAPIDIALEAEDDLIHLPIITDSAAD